MDVGMIMLFASHGWGNYSNVRTRVEEIRLTRFATDPGYDCL
jgi:hypothetical protein